MDQKSSSVWITPVSLSVTDVMGPHTVGTCRMNNIVVSGDFNCHGVNKAHVAKF